MTGRIRSKGPHRFLTLEPGTVRRRHRRLNDAVVGRGRHHSVDIALVESLVISLDDVGGVGLLEAKKADVPANPRVRVSAYPSLRGQWRQAA